MQIDRLETWTIALGVAGSVCGGVSAYFYTRMLDELNGRLDVDDRIDSAFMSGRYFEVIRLSKMFCPESVQRARMYGFMAACFGLYIAAGAVSFF